MTELEILNLKKNPLKKSKMFIIYFLSLITKTGKGCGILF
jgi:hypothetical protein